MIFLSKIKLINTKGVFSSNCWIRLFSFLLACVFIFSCKTTKQKVSKEIKSENNSASNRLSDSLTILINSSNLSEDMSTLSSNDDELVLFIYDYTDSIISSRPYFNKYFILNKSKMSDTIYYNGIKNILNKNLILLFIEMDTDKKMEEIEALLRKNHVELLKAYSVKNYSVIEKYLGDDDLLGIKTISTFRSPTTIEWSDIYRMDRFSYEIILK